MNKKGLGKGLGALLSTADTTETGVIDIKINDIEPNMEQPRKVFDDEKLIQLAESIKQHGIVQPIIVRKENDIYKIVAGERRWRAARIAGIDTVPVLIKELSKKEVIEVALIENIQREDLNPIEEAEAYDRLIQEYNVTQDVVSATVGKSRSAIANILRLLNLTEEVKGYLIDGQLTSGHARALLAIEDKYKQKDLAENIIQNSLNVRETERLVKESLKAKTEKKKVEKNENVIEIEDKIKNILGTKVTLVANNKKGKIMIEYYSNDELERLMELFGKIGS